jgi:hypothetical protein
MPPIEIGDVVPAKVPHHARTRIGGLRCKQEVNVVGHQAVGMDGATVPKGKFTQAREINKVIRLSMETGDPIYAALNDVQCDTGKDVTQVPGHAVSTKTWGNR